MKNSIVIAAIFSLALISVACESNSGTNAKPSTVVIVDQTLSTKQLRSDDSVERFLKAIVSRPELNVQLYGMMPDRIYPSSVDNLLSKSYGLDESGKFTGGDLQRIISDFDNSPSDCVVIVTDAENNYGNTANGIPSFTNPDKFWLVGVRPDLWQEYTDAGVHAYTVDQVNELVIRIVSTGAL